MPAIEAPPEQRRHHHRTNSFGPAFERKQCRSLGIQVLLIEATDLNRTKQVLQNIQGDERDHDPEENIHRSAHEEWM